jgi:sRNA-binding carbon storage regulator CsrA
MACGGSRRLRDIDEVEVTAGGSHMLVITRREGEEVVIGDPSNPIGVIRIATIKGDRVRIAREIAVHRKEVAIEIANSGPAIAGKIRPATNE